MLLRGLPLAGGVIPTVLRKCGQYMVFCEPHNRVLLATPDEALAHRFAASHDRLQHADTWFVPPARPRVGPLDYFDMNSGEVRRVA